MERRYDCKFYDRSFITNSNLFRHERNAHGVKSQQTKQDLNCEECDKQFTSVTNRDKHVRTFHEATHTCEITPPVASPKTSVTSFWQCGVCGKKYPSNKALVRHQRSHTEQRPYSCDFCEKTYSEKRNLVSHIRMHTGERPYRCDLCEKTFTVYGSLASHKRTHTGERPYACDLCRKTFIQSNGLVKHLRTHTGERPYRCDFCQKTFSQSSSLVRHLRTHIGEHPCENGVTTKEDGHIREPNMT